MSINYEDLQYQKYFKIKQGIRNSQIDQNNIQDIIKEHASTNEEIQKITGIEQKKLKSILKMLLKTGKIERITVEGVLYYTKKDWEN